MKPVFFSLALSLLLSFCTTQPKPTLESSEAAVPAADSNGVEAVSMTVDIASSSIAWEGFEGIQLLNSEHNGTIALKQGTVSVSGGILAGGTFTIDMNSIVVLDIPADKKGNAKLTNHLKSEDFFDAARFPEATFVITSTAVKTSDSLLVTGNLTLKDITKSISFPAVVSVTDSSFAASARFYINRKDWNVLYRSEESLGDKMIRPEIGLKLDLKAAL